MRRLTLLLASFILFLIGLGVSPTSSYSNSAVAIITSVESYQRPDGNYVCDLLVSYNANSFTLVHQVPLHIVSPTNYTFGQTITIYYNPRDPQTISISPYSPTSQTNLFFLLLAMALGILLTKRE
jgi:hypothetical protein